MRRAVENRWTERPPALAVFDLRVDLVGDALHRGVAQNAAVAERARTKFHATLKPRDNFARREQIARDIGDGRDFLVANVALLQCRLDLGIRILRAEIRVLHRLDRVAKGVGGVGRRTKRGAGIARGGLNEQFAIFAETLDEPLVALHIQCYPAGVAKPLGSLYVVAE